MLAAALAPQMAMADIAAADEELKRLFGDRPIEQSKITLDVPQSAENGLVVPLSVLVDSPMTVATR